MSRVYQSMHPPEANRPARRVNPWAVKPSAAGASAAVLGPPPNVFPNVGPPLGVLTVLLGFYVLLYTIPAMEILTFFVHVPLPIVPLVGVAITLAFPFTGEMGRFLRTPVAKPWILLMACYLAAAAFSTYRSASIPPMLEYCFRVQVMPFFFCAIAITTRRVRHLMSWAITASLILLLVCRLIGQAVEGRFALLETSLKNPNDLAFQLLFDCAFLLFLVFHRSWIGKGIWALTLPLSVMYILKTGSRASFVTMIGVMVVAWLLSPRSTKAALLLLTPVLLVLATMFVPASTWGRLELILMNPRLSMYSTSDENLRNAIASQMARQELQKRAWSITWRHPLLGVGPLMFADAADAMVREETGHKTSWQYPHNVYLQTSSENGIPALIFYVWSIIACFRMNYRSYKLCRREPDKQLDRSLSFCLMLATFIYAFGILFCNVTYYAYLALLVGFSSAHFLAVQQEIKTKSPSPQSPVSNGSRVPQVA